MARWTAFDANRLGTTALGFMVVGSAAAIGGVHWPTTLILAAIAALFAVMAGLGNGSIRGRRLTLLFLALIVASGWAVLQSLPLGGLAKLLSPAMADVWQRAGSDGARLTANVPATAVWAVRCAAAAVLFWGARLYFQRVERGEHFLDVFLVSAGLAAALGLVQAWLGSTQIWFFYTPEMGPVRAGVRGPFVNPDHLGAYASAAALVALVRGYTLRLQRLRHLYYGTFVLFFATLLLTMSVGAWVGFGVGFVATAFALSRRGQPVRELVSVTVTLVGVAVVVAALCVSMFNMLDPRAAWSDEMALWRRQAEVWRGGLALLKTHLVAGVGSGSTVDLINPHLSPPAMSVWFVRSQPLQVLLDAGVVVGGLLLAALAGSLRVVLRHWSPDHLHILLPASAGLISLITLSLFDFALELPAIGIVGVLLLGLVSAQWDRLSKPVTKEAKPAAAAPATPARAPSRRGAHVWLVVGLLLLATSAAWAVVQNQRYDDSQDAPNADAAALVLSSRPAYGRIFTHLGQAQLAQGQLDEAAQSLESALLLLPNDALTNRLAGLAALRQGQTDVAGQRLAVALQADPGHGDLTLQLLIEAPVDFDLALAVAQTEDQHSRLVDL